MQQSVAVKYNGDPLVHALSFSVDMNLQASKATDRVGTGGIDFCYYHPHGLLPESGDYLSMKRVVLQRCAAINWAVYADSLTKRRGIIESRQIVRGFKRNSLAINREWSDLHKELGAHASFEDLVLYLARIYGEDPKMVGIGFDLETQEVISWQDSYHFEYTFRGLHERTRRVDPERYV